MTSTEMWKAVVGFEDHYAVSNHGQVVRTGRAKGATVGRVLKQKLGRSGYRFVNLSVEDVSTSVDIHILVAMAFLGAKPEGCEVRHADGDKENNFASNLEWATRSENLLHGSRVLGRKLGTPWHKNPNTRLTPESVASIRRDAAAGMSQYAIGRKYGIAPNTAWYVINRKTWKHVA